MLVGTSVKQVPVQTFGHALLFEAGLCFGHEAAHAASGKSPNHAPADDAECREKQCPGVPNEMTKFSQLESRALMHEACANQRTDQKQRNTWALIPPGIFFLLPSDGAPWA